MKRRVIISIMSSFLAVCLTAGSAFQIQAEEFPEETAQPEEMTETVPQQEAFPEAELTAEETVQEELPVETETAEESVTTEETEQPEEIPELQEETAEPVFAEEPEEFPEETEEPAPVMEPEEELPEETAEAEEELPVQTQEPVQDGEYGFELDEDFGTQLYADDYPNIFTGNRSVQYYQTEARRMLSMVNKFRTSGKAWYWNKDDKTKTTGIKVAALEYDTALEDIAMQRAAEIGILMQHTRPSGQDCFSAYYEYNGTAYRANGENILYGTGPYGANAESSFDMWKEEDEPYLYQGHRRNMLNANFTAIGIGYAYINGYNLWVMELGYKTPVPDKEPLDGKMTRSIPVHSQLIDSYSSWTADPASVSIGVNEYAEIPDISVKTTVSGLTGTFTMKAYPYSGSLDHGEQSIYEITEDYQIHGLSLGTADLYITIPAGSSNKKFTIPINVITRVESVALNKTEAIVDRDTTLQLSAEVLPEDAHDKSVKWSSSDPSVASVDQNGLVTAKKGGTAVITATTNDGGLTASCTITVEVHVTSVELEYETFRLTEGMTESLGYAISPADALDQTVTWTSSDPEVLTVDETGLVTALKPGTSEVTIKTNDREYTDTVKVTVVEQKQVSSPVLALFDETGKRITAEHSVSVRKGTMLYLLCDTDDADILYSIDGTEQFYTSAFAADRPMTITCYAKKAGMKDSEPSVYEISILDESVNADPGDLCPEDVDLVNEEYGGIVPEGIWAAGIDEEIVYTGAKITFPELRVYDHKTLLDKKSYSVTYKNNVNVSSETYASRIGWTPAKKTTVSYLQIKGKGNYTGTVYVPFRIMPKSLEDEDIQISDLWLKASGKALKPVPAVTYNGKKLKINKEYSVVYIDADGQEHPYSEGITDAGTYTVKISAMGTNYTGTAAANLIVDNSAETVLMSKTKVTIGKWNGEEGMPVTEDTPLAITVKSGSKTLHPDTYRVISVINGDHAGTASLVLQGTGVPDPETNIVLLGERTVKFTITGISISKAVTSIEPFVYTGSAITPDSFEVALNGTKLEKDSDYEIVSYASNIKAGKKASVKIKGIGKYTSTKTFRFEITRADIHDVSAEISSAAEYQPSGAVPEMKLTYEGNLLKAGTDYTVKYSGARTAGSVVSWTISGKGNFAGTLDGTFTVEKKELSGTVLTANDIVRSTSKKGTYYQAKVNLKDGGKALGVKDYDKASVTYTYEQDTRVQVPVASKTLRTVLRLAGDPVGPADIPVAGSVIRITVSAAENGNYTGSASGTYRILPAGHLISAASVKFNVTKDDGTVVQQKSLTKQYTGKAVVLKEEDLYLTLKVDGSTYVLTSADYEIVSYANNIKKGTASVTIRGKGDFGGTKTIKFKIGSQKLSLLSIFGLY